MIKRFTCVFAIGCSLLVACLSVGCNGSERTDHEDDGKSVEQQLDEAREAHKKYTDISKAIEDGYHFEAHYTTSPDGEGAMGIHLVNPSIQGLEPEAANVLVYTVDDSGAYELVAVEWFVPADQFDEAPEMFGETFEGPMPGHEDGQPEHYELHAWLYRDNPEGMFATWNPAIDPPSYTGDLNSLAEAVQPYHDVEKATEDGYERQGECAAHPEDPSKGAMGIHYLKLENTGLEPTEPNVLVYEPTDDGKQLVAAEWFIPAWMYDETPELFGQTFEGPMPGHEDGQPEHYELHVWIGEANPGGLFATWNPVVSCPDDGSGHDDSH